MTDVRTLDKPVLDIRDLRVRLNSGPDRSRDLLDVSFQLFPGETLGLVGESGSGKSMTALSIMGLLPQPAIRMVSGRIEMEGVDLAQLSQRELRAYRGRRVSMVLQDPMTALNPVLTIGEQIEEAIRIHQDLPPAKVRERAVEMLRLLHVPSPEARLSSYPHEFSGGMRQRVVGAIALACEPQVLIADEPTTALDVTVQDQYLRLLKEIQSRKNISIIFITHDLSVVARLCDRVAVMYAGQIVETAPTRTLFDTPRHPYTKALLRSLLRMDCDPETPLQAIEGTPPLPDEVLTGCPFAPRCDEVMTVCRTTAPQEIALAPRTAARCWRVEA